MFLNPAEPVWPGLLKAALVLALFVISGAPVARAVFGERPRNVWVGYAPIMGVGLHLLTANLCAWVAPGAVGSWLGLAAAVTAAGLIAVRTRTPLRRPEWPRVTWAWPAAGVLLTAGLLYVALANRTHVLFTDEEWHLPLTATMAHGTFPPISPFAPTFGAAYHYGSDLLAASLMNLAGVAPWTAFFVLTPLLAVVFPITAATAARDFEASRLIAAGAGLVAAFANPTFIVGLPTAGGDLSLADGLGELLGGFGVSSDAPLFMRMGPTQLNYPHFALGITLLIVMAVSVQAGRNRRQLAVFGAALALLPLAETSAFIVGAVGMTLYFAITAWRMTWRERRAWAVAAAGGVLLACLAGGALTDTLFRNPGGAGTEIGFYPDTGVLTPGAVSPEGGLNLQLSPLLLIMGLTLAAIGLRSRGLGFLAVTAAGGLVARQLLNFDVTGVDTRLLWIPYTLAALGGVAALGALVNRVHPAAAGHAAGAVLVALVVLPTAAPRTVSSLEISARGIYLGYPVVQHDVARYANQTRFAGSLRDQWRGLDWMRRELPDDARILAMNAPFVSLATGRAAPQSDDRLALFNPLPTPLHMDALRFLSGIDLEDLGVTHIYVTPALLDTLDVAARAALDDPRQFRLLSSQLSSRGTPLLVYAIQPGVGRESPDASSYRRLTALGRQAPVRAVGGFLTFPQRQTLLLTFASEHDVLGPDTYMPRTNIQAKYEASGPSPPQGLLILNDTHVPTAVGKAFDDAVWQGYGLRAYATWHSAWSQTWRPQPQLQTPPPELAKRYSRPDAGCELHVIGEPGDLVTIGDRELRLTGVPQLAQTSSATCAAMQVDWSGSDVPPFIQIRPSRSEIGAAASASAGLAFDGGVSDGIGIFHVWYRNPDRTPIPGGSELRLYPAGPDGLIEASSPTHSIARWLGLIELSKDRFTDRFEFDAAALRLNGTAPIEQTGELVDGAYVLSLNVAEESEGGGRQIVRRVIPVMRVTVLDGRPTYEPLSGIVGVD